MAFLVRVVSSLATVETPNVPAGVWRTVCVDPRDVLDVTVEPFVEGTGAASGRVELVSATVRGRAPVSMVRKSFGRLVSGPHAEASQEPDHWAHWSRELTAYQSGVLPDGPSLRAPRLYGVVDDVLYIEYVGDRQPEPAEAAAALGRWHAEDRTRDRPWLASHQLAQRLAVSDLDWSSVQLNPRLSDIWDQRYRLLASLDAIPWSIAHGDFSTGNLRIDSSRGGETGLVAIDWATLGRSPVGFDIAHLALAALDESLLGIYLDGLAGRYEPDAVRTGYRVTALLVGTSRAHWMASRSIPLPPGYPEFIGELAH